MTPSKSLETPRHGLGLILGRWRKQSVFLVGSDSWSWSWSPAGVCISVLYAVLFGAEMTSRTPLACRPLVLEDCVDVIHFAQPLEEGDEVQQLGVGHVVEPRGHGHLDENTSYQTSNIIYPLLTVVI